MKENTEYQTVLLIKLYFAGVLYAQCCVLDLFDTVCFTMNNIMSAQDSLLLNQQEAQGGISSGTYIVHQSVWQMNEPINIGCYAPTVKHEILPIITKIESFSDPPTTASARYRVCNLLGLNNKWPMKMKKEELRKKIKKVDHGLCMESHKVKACKSIFISQMPTWFEYHHMKALIQLMSDFNVDSDTYYIDMFQDLNNRKRGQCLLRFMENEDCIKLFEELQGIQLKDGPILVKLDLDHKIAEERDSCNLDESFVRFKEMCELKNEYEGENVPETSPTINIKVETENEDSDNNLQLTESEIKTEILDYSPELEIGNNVEVKQEIIIETGSIKTEPEETNECNNQNVEDFPNLPINYDRNFYNCKIVHVKNLLGTCKSGQYYEIAKSWIRNDVGLDVLFNFRKVLQDDKKTPTGDILLEFSKHREAKKVQKKLDGFVYKGRKLAAEMGVGYEIKPQVTISDLKIFRLKRKSLNDFNDDDDQQPAKKARTDAPSTPDHGEIYTTGYMPLDDGSYEAYGLSAEFMKKLNIRVPLSRTVIVFQLHKDVNKEKLYEVFSLAGVVRKMTINPDKSNKQWNKARIEYDHPLEAVQAKSMFHKQKLYNQEMHLEMETAPEKNFYLPKGLSAVGPGLANNGLPMRGLRTIAELRIIHELFAYLGYMERITNVDKPMKYSYRKAKLPDQPRNPNFYTNSSSDKDSNSSSRTSHSTRPSSDNSTNKSSSNANSSLGPKSSNANTSKDMKTESQDSESSESSLLALQELGTILVTQGLIPSTTNCYSVHNILAALQNSPIENHRPDEQSFNSNANVNVHASNTGIPTQNLLNTNIPLNRTDALNQAINQVMQFMPANTATNVQPNLQQNFQNFAPSVPNVPVQNMNINAPLNNPIPYGIPPSRFDVGSTGNPTPQAPLLPTPPGRAPFFFFY